MANENKKILITGGCGFIGTNLAIYLKKFNYEVSTLDNLFRKGSKYNLKLLKSLGIKNYKIDIYNQTKLFKLKKFDIIIDCCAEAAVNISKYETTRVINTNLVGTINLVKKAKFDNSIIIFISTSRVYSIKELNLLINKKSLKKKLKINKSINEKFNTLSPKSIYGFTKLASEMVIQEYAYAFDLKYLINRCGVISGPLQFGSQEQGFISLWLWRHLNRKKLSYTGFGGYGNQVRDVLHVIDLCELIKLQLDKFSRLNNKVFNVGGSKKNSISLRELTKICQAKTKNKIKINSIKNTSIYDIPYYVSNNSYLYKNYNWRPKRNINAIINDTLNWMIKNNNQIKKFF